MIYIALTVRKHYFFCVSESLVEISNNLLSTSHRNCQSWMYFITSAPWAKGCCHSLTVSSVFVSPLICLFGPQQCQGFNASVSYLLQLLAPPWHGPRPNNDISMKFKIRPKFEVLWFKMYSTDHNEMLHTSRQCNRSDVCKISLYSVENILNYSTPNFYQISNLIEIPLVGRGGMAITVFAQPVEICVTFWLVTDQSTFGN